MSINAGELNSPIMAPFGVFFVQLVNTLRHVPECQAIVHQVDMASFVPTSSQKIRSLDVCMNVLRFVEKLKPFQLARRIKKYNFISEYNNNFIPASALSSKLFCRKNSDLLP